MLKIKDIKKVRCYEDLEGLGIGNIYCDISHRGGGIGFYSSDVAAAFEVSDSDLPRKFGAGCNYLGGGLRGSIFPSSFNKTIIGKKAALLEALAEACTRVYENIEGQEGLNDEEYPDGDKNWDAIGTSKSRKTGIISAY